ncbi:MAG: hypothetical protein IT193_09105 [Propionibacteriaceae bacterium]|nr:hypothetical protein [Propionibacteriaceae bacterium]
MISANSYWSGRFNDWPSPRPAEPGYTLLVPVPGDLPVFLELALNVLARQDSDHRVETLVIPDKMTPAMTAITAGYAKTWQGPLRTLPLPLPERYVLPLMRNPGRNHGVQLIEGIGQARGSHVLLHDADLFLLDPGVLDERWVEASTDRLFALGVSPVWDSWYAERGFDLTATWELCADRDWLRSFPPAMHIGHEAEALGERHVFDTTLRAQLLSDPKRIRTHEIDDRIVHFNYVISTYRHFQNAKGSYADNKYRLLLIRLFVDLFATYAAPYNLPTLDELAQSLTSSDGPVTYPEPTAAASADYQAYRRNVDRILAGPWAAEKGADLAERLAPFDSRYATD